MISARQLVYGLETKLNKLSTNAHQQIPLGDSLIALNKAQINLIKRKLSTNNIYTLGLDSFKKRYEDLQKLIVISEKISVSKVDGIYESYTFDVNDLQNKYMFLVNVEALCSKGSCLNRPISTIKITKHSDLPVLMDNTNYVPSFEYQETLALISSDKVNLYTDKSFSIDSAYVTYIRYPQKIDLEGYIDLNGNTSVNSDCELADYLEDEILDLAVLELAMSTENVPAIQSTEIRLKNNE